MGVIVCVCVVNGKGCVWVWCEERNVWCLRSGVCVGVSEGRWCNIIYLLSVISDIKFVDEKNWYVSMQAFTKNLHTLQLVFEHC